MAAILLSRFKVRDYDAWREVFVSKADLRKENGCNGTHIFFNVEDKNEVTIKVDDNTKIRVQMRSVLPLPKDETKEQKPEPPPAELK